MFSFTFDPSSGSEITLESPVMINSSSFRTLDFEVVMTASNQVKISYQGVARQFGPGRALP